MIGERGKGGREGERERAGRVIPVSPLPLVEMRVHDLDHVEGVGFAKVNNLLSCWNILQ